jgi:hypothetical protein
LYQRNLIIELLVKENAITTEAQYPNISTPDNSKMCSLVGQSILTLYH